MRIDCGPGYGEYFKKQGRELVVLLEIQPMRNTSGNVLLLAPLATVEPADPNASIRISE